MMGKLMRSNLTGYVAFGVGIGLAMKWLLDDPAVRAHHVPTWSTLAWIVGYFAVVLAIEIWRRFSLNDLNKRSTVN